MDNQDVLRLRKHAVEDQDMSIEELMEIVPQ
jgi:hypothetical protein